MTNFFFPHNDFAFTLLQVNKHLRIKHSVLEEPLRAGGGAQW